MKDHLKDRNGKPSAKRKNGDLGFKSGLVMGFILFFLVLLKGIEADKIGSLVNLVLGVLGVSAGMLSAGVFEKKDNVQENNNENV